jgi:hypothetical protein
MGAGTHFYWQHDARMESPTTVSLFDDGSSPPEEQESRGLVLGVDETRRTVTLVHQYAHPARLLAPNQGSMQTLPGGGAFIGWGAEPYFSQFAADGSLLLDGRMPNNVQSYRAYLQQWNGMPTETPAVAVRKSAVIGFTVYASWNGSTRVAQWQVLAGADPASLTTAATSRRSAFETAVAVSATGPYFVAVALDSSGHELSRSLPVKAG